MDWVYYFILLGLLVAAICLQAIALPGLWVMVAATLGYAWLTHFAHLGWGAWAAVLGLALCAEATEFLASSTGAKKAGGSKRAMLGAVVGAVLGGILLSIPVPIVGTIVGVCIGAFAGAAGVELLIHGEAEKSTRVGFGAAKGALVGILIKLTFGVLIILLVAWRALPTGGRPVPVPAPANPPAPAAQPAAEPATQP
jgi:uncharacterized protein YqgC (DUF456 family)